jgi:tight adherence protein B
VSLALKFLVVVLTCSFVLFVIVLRSPSPSKLVWRRLANIQNSVHPESAALDGLGLEKIVRRRYSAWLDAFLQSFQFAGKTKTLLIHADSTMGVSEVVLLSGGLWAALGMSCYFYLRLPLLAAAIGIAGSAIPYGYLRFKRARRVKAFNVALPDAIDLMARSLVAGHSIGSSIEMIADQSPEPLSFEFVQVFQQQRLGIQFRDALLQMGSRVPSRDLQFLITAILVQKETGGDLTEILARASHVIRDRVRIEGEVQTRTVQGRLTGWILGLLPLVMLGLTNLASPGYSHILFYDPLGQKLLYAGGILIVFGALIIRKIVDVRV